MTTPAEQRQADLYAAHIAQLLAHAGLRVALPIATVKCVVIDTPSVNRASIAARVLGDLGYEYASHGETGTTFTQPPRRPAAWSSEPACVHGWASHCPEPYCCKGLERELRQQRKNAERSDVKGASFTATTKHGGSQ